MLSTADPYRAICMIFARERGHTCRQLTSDIAHMNRRSSHRECRVAVDKPWHAQREPAHGVRAATCVAATFLFRPRFRSVQVF